MKWSLKLVADRSQQAAQQGDSQALADTRAYIRSREKAKRNKEWREAKRQALWREFVQSRKSGRLRGKNKTV